MEERESEAPLLQFILMFLLEEDFEWVYTAMLRGLNHRVFVLCQKRQISDKKQREQGPNDEMPSDVLSISLYALYCPEWRIQWPALAKSMVPWYLVDVFCS